MLTTPPGILEQERRLSASLLWRLQRRFFELQGVAAWAAGTVPHYVTGNAWIAGAYAKVVFAWLRDCAGTGARERASFPPLDLRHPVHVLELGCGSGRFGFLFLRRLLDLLARSHLDGVAVRYVLSDFAESNLAALRSHPALQPWAQAGRLDFARYDAGLDTEVRLDLSGEVLAPGTLRNPLVVLANYVFDGIPQDAFTVRGGRLHELLATLASPQAEPDLDDPGLLERVEIRWEERPARAARAARAGYYGEPELDAILEEHAGRLDGTCFLFPSAALRCLGNLARLADDRLLLLSGDKGYCREEMLAGRGEPGLAVHGSFSLMVNYHALGRWFERRGGAWLDTTHLCSSLNVVAGLLGTPPGGTVETRLAFDDAIERMGPDDFFDLKKSVEQGYEELTLAQLLAWLRLSGWDANVLLGCFPALMERLAAAPEILRREAYRAVHEVWRAYFPLGEERDLAFHLGVLLCEIDCHEDALGFFRRSLAENGPNPATAFNMGLCLFHLGRLAAARRQVDEALAGAPDFAPALALREQIARPARQRGKRRREEGTDRPRASP